MRLSDAIALGRVTISQLAPGSLYGCALGMAANAAGIEVTYSSIEREWPWLKTMCPSTTPSFNLRWMGAVAHRFDWEVMKNETLSLDQLIDWVRSVEPPETGELLAENPQNGQAIAAHKLELTR